MFEFHILVVTVVMLNTLKLIMKTVPNYPTGESPSLQPQATCGCHHRLAGLGKKTGMGPCIATNPYSFIALCRPQYAFGLANISSLYVGFIYDNQL
jgi:hypothetical protein